MSDSALLASEVLAKPSLGGRIRGRLMRMLLPLYGPKFQYSMIYPTPVIDPVPPTPELIDLALDAAKIAGMIDLTDLSSRVQSGPRYADIWPGEHYKLLAALVKIMKPQVVIEVGTYTGLSALTLKKFLDSSAKLVTFDLIAWDRFQNTVMKAEDFADGRLSQMLADLADPAVLREQQSLVSAADLIFVDAPKDGSFEPRFLAALRDVPFAKPPLVILDDIHFWNMIGLWSSLPYPKLDITSFGHWTGTGMIRWDVTKHPAKV